MIDPLTGLVLVVGGGFVIFTATLLVVEAAMAVRNYIARRSEP